MLKLICSLDGFKEEPTLKHEVEAGGAFEVALLVEHAGEEGTSTSFDSIVLEILYNDQDYVLTTDPRSRPIPGELAENASDFFNRTRKVRPGTLLTLRHATGDPSGPYKNATGRAGYVSDGGSFEVSPNKPVVAGRGLVFALAESNLGPSNLVVVGQIYKGSTPIATESVVSTVNVVPRKSGPAAYPSGLAPTADHGWVP